MTRTAPAVAVTGLTLVAIGGAAALLLRHPPAGSGDATVVTVVAGEATTAPPLVVHRIEAPPATHRDHPRAPAAVAALSHAKADARVMNHATQVQAADARGAAIEQQVATAFRANSAVTDMQDLVVTCKVTLCEVAGVTGVDPTTARSALRADRLLKAMAALGYSSGPDEEAVQDGRTAFVMYLNREI